MYALFYCDEFDTHQYQLCRFDLGFQANGWHNTASICLLDDDFTKPSTDNVITTSATRIQRFELSHNYSKQLKLLAEAPSVEAFFELYPELFV